MKKTKIFTLTLLLATLVAGCTKEQTEPAANNSGQAQKGHLYIFANGFGGDSKVSINPNDPTEAATWKESEFIRIDDMDNDLQNDIDCYIELDGERYSLKNRDNGEWVTVTSTPMTAFYPGGNFDGNEVSVDATGIVMNRLRIKFMDDGKQLMAFPMMAPVNADESAVYFDHLSAGVQVTLRNNKNTAVNVSSLTIVAQSTTDVVNLGIGSVTARWANQGPWMPMGQVGNNGNEVDVKFASVMNFDLRDEVGANAYKTIAANSELVFCVPITISSMKYLKVTGYGENGEVLFSVKKGFANDVTVERNHMYTFPEIPIN